jgi:WD40 repeat protein
VWDIENGKAVLRWRHETPNNFDPESRFARFQRINPVQAVCVSSDARFAVSGVHSFKNHLIVWDLRTGQPRATLDAHWNGVIALALDMSGEVLASGSSDKRIVVWDMKTARKIRELSGHTDAVSALVFSTDGHYLLSGSRDASLILWDVNS